MSFPMDVEARCHEIAEIFCVSDKHMAFLRRWQGESAQPLGSELGGWRRSEIVLV